MSPSKDRGPVVPSDSSMTDHSPRNSSSVPLLPHRDQESSPAAAAAAAAVTTTTTTNPTTNTTASDSTSESDEQSRSEAGSNKAKSGKRRLFGLGRKKDDETMAEANLTPASSQAPLMPSTQAAVAAMRPVSPLQPSPADVKPLPIASPNRSFAPSSPRLAAPSSPQYSSSLAESQIFERNVQESTVPSELALGIPSHIQTEDHIPPALEASSLAITNNRLDPDHVEIVTHTAHQPAATTIAEGTSSALHSDLALPLSPQDSQHESIYSALSRQQDSSASAAGEGDTASNYASLDPNDVKRLSFISFADVVQAEHAETTSLHTMSMPLSATSLTQHHGSVPNHTRSPRLDRSPSPMRSPGSSHSQSFNGLGTPPLIGSNPASMKGLDLSPGRSPVLGTASPHQHHGELTIETMTQALRKTGSGDLGAAAKSGSASASGFGSGSETGF